VSLWKFWPRNSVSASGAISQRDISIPGGELNILTQSKPPDANIGEIIAVDAVSTPEDTNTVFVFNEPEGLSPRRAPVCQNQHAELF
jgi:hypothetical protein